MDMETGKIHEMTEEAVQAAKNAMPPLTPLTPDEHLMVLKVREEDRPMTLALHRFVSTQRKTAGSHSMAVRQAFCVGFAMAREHYVVHRG